MYIFDPKQYDIHEKCRLCIRDMTQENHFPVKAVLEEGEVFRKPLAEFAEHMEYRFKIQLWRDGAWRDHTRYARVVPEYVAENDLHYLFYPCTGSRFLAVGFQAINTKPLYNYIRPLQGLPVHRLYIRDWMGGDELTHSSYYLGPNKTLTIAEACQRLIAEYCEKYRIEPENTIFFGSSKGGYAALYHGIAFGAGHIVAGSPQTRLAAFLAHDHKEDCFRNRIFEWLFGPRTDENKAYADALLFEHAEKLARPHQKVSIMVGRHETHYTEHVLPFQQAFRDRLDFNIVLGEYREHTDTARHYPPFLRETVAAIIENSRKEPELSVDRQNLPPLFPYENLANDPVTSELVLRCESFINTGWERDGHVTPLDSIPWRLLPGIPQSFNFRIHCLDMCQDLLLVFSSGGAQKFFDAAARAALEWCGRYCEGKNADDSPYIWYDMSAGMRAYRLAYIYEVLQRNSLGSAEDRELLWKSLLEHRRYLEDDANIAFHSNHGYYQIVGQMAMGRRLAVYDPAMRDFYAQGQQRFAEMLRTQFTEEGIHKENSPYYHRMLLLTLRAIVKSGLAEDPDILAFTDRIEHSLSSFVCPDRTMLQFGDSDARDITVATEANALSKWGDPAMQYLASGGKVGNAPEFGLLTYPLSGYAVVRRPGKRFPEVFHDQSYLALNAAFHSRTHRHADDLTMTWYDRGQHILVDAGRYGYVGKTEKDSPQWLDGFWYSDPFRMYCESTRAHNTLEFDGRNNPRRRTPLYGSALRRCGERDGVFFMEAELRLFKTIRRVRTLLFKPASWLLIHDWFHDNLSEPHTVRQWFHTAPHLTMQPDEHGWHGRLAEEGSLHVTSLLPDMQPMPVVRGQESPELQGWCSRQPLEKMPNDAFGYEKKDSPNGNFAVLFTFSEVQADRKWARMSASGRKGRFCWRDADGVHRIELERPAEGDLTFSYTIKN